MAFRPLVTVGFVLGDYETHLLDSLTSICSQTYEDLEILVLDNCASDGSAEIAKLLGRMDPRVTVMHNEEQLPLAECKNRLLRIASGYLFCLVPGDDSLEFNAISALVAPFGSYNDLGVSYSDRRVIYSSGELGSVHRAPDALANHMGRLAWTQFFLTRTDFLLGIGGFLEVVPGCENADVLMRLGKQYPSVRVPLPLHRFRKGDGRVEKKKVSCRVCSHLAACHFYEVWVSAKKKSDALHRGGGLGAIKIKIDASPCSGKSAFLRKHRALYRNVALFDSDRTKAAVGLVDSKFLEHVAVDSCLLGPLEECVDMRYAHHLAVIIPLGALDRNIRKRAEKYPGKYWSKGENIFRARDQLEEFCSRFGVPVFESFAAAIDYAIDELGSPGSPVVLLKKTPD